MVKYKVTRDDETLDEIVFNYYGASFTYLEKTLEENHFLGFKDLHIPKGTVITLPELEQEPNQERETLWS